MRPAANHDRITRERPQLVGYYTPALGLSIVRSVSHAHGGDVHATPRPDGGLAVHVRMPQGPNNGGYEAR